MANLFLDANIFIDLEPISKPNFVTKQSSFRAKVESFDEGVATATSRRKSQLAADNEIVAVGSRFRDRF